tara:strand:- start:20792 stop:22606 length:1815 start_codon:yes stop_codon:yes gene_type:complete
MAQNKPKSIKEAQAQGSMYFWDKKGNKQLAVTAKQLAAFKKSDLYDPDSKKGALTQWANAAKKQGIEAVVPALKVKREAEEKRKAEIKEAKRQAELKKRQKLEAGRLAEQKRKVELQESKRQAELQQRQEVERQRIEAEKKDPIEEFAVQHEKAASHADKFERAIAYLMPNEGGYNSEEDSKYGISKATYPELDIENLTMAQAIEIYRKDWWQPYKELPGPIAIKAFDTAVNVGHHRAQTWLQEATTEAGEGNIDGILQGMSSRQMTHYQGLSSWEKYKGGWTARANRLPELAGPPEIDEVKTRNEIKELRDNKIPAHKIINMRSRMNERRYGVTRNDVKDQIKADANWEPGNSADAAVDISRQIGFLESMKQQNRIGLHWLDVPTHNYHPDHPNEWQSGDIMPYQKKVEHPPELHEGDSRRWSTHGLTVGSGERTRQEYYLEQGVSPLMNLEGLGTDAELNETIVKDGYLTIMPNSTVKVVFHEMIHEQINRYHEAGLLPSEWKRANPAGGPTQEHAFIDWLISQAPVGTGEGQLPDYLHKRAVSNYTEWTNNAGPPGAGVATFEGMVNDLNEARMLRGGQSNSQSRFNMAPLAPTIPTQPSP